MPRKTVTYDLQEELERINQEMDDLADEVAGLPSDAPKRQQLAQQGTQLERRMAGVEWAITDPEPDEEDHPDRPYESVELASLEGREYFDVAGEVDKDPDSNQLMAKVLLVAKGLVDAPFIEEDMTDAQKVQAVGGLEPNFIRYLANRVDELTTPDVSGNGFAQRVAERTTQ